MIWECSGWVVEFLINWLETERPQVWASPASLHCGPWARHIYPSLVLVQPRKTRPCLTERLLMEHKESNQTNKQHDIFEVCGKYSQSCYSRISLSCMTLLLTVGLQHDIFEVCGKYTQYCCSMISLSLCGFNYTWYPCEKLFHIVPNNWYVMWDLNLSCAKDFRNLISMVTWCISWRRLLALIIFQRSSLK